MIKLKMVTIVITQEDNPLVWEDDKYQNIVGYLMAKASKIKLTLYLSPKPISDSINQTQLINLFVEWLEDLAINTKDNYRYQNPPLEYWLETKKEWCIKIADKLSKKYNKDFNDSLSHLYEAILRCYNKNNIYLGNLNYLELAAFNEIKVDYRYNLKRLHGGNSIVMSLDYDYTNKHNTGDDKSMSLYETISYEKPEHNPELYSEMKTLLMKGLASAFTPREIDQIVNAISPTYLPRNIYRRLLVWRKLNPKEKFINDEM